MFIFKVGAAMELLFFQIFYLMVPKIEICLKYFLEKNLKKAAILKSEKKAESDGYNNDFYLIF
jgi:hypothetical protein